MPNTQTQKNQKNSFSLSDYFPAFKSGPQTDSAGNERTWTNADLDQIVANTNSRIEKNIYSGTPFVIGHPETNDPAYAWTADVRRVGDELQVKGDKIYDAFETGVKDGLWPNRSIRIGQDESGYYLKHVGFLGAAAPAVDGLDAVYSARDGDTFFDYAANYEFSSDSYTPGIVARLFRRFRDYVIEKDGVEKADELIPDYEINSLSEHAIELRNKDKESDSPSSFNKPAFNKPDDGDPMPTKEEMDAAVAAAEKRGRDSAQADFSASETTLKEQLADEQNKNKRRDYQSQVDGLIDKGQLTPAQASGIVDFMLNLGSGDDVTLEFAESNDANAKMIKIDPIKWFSDFVAQLPVQVDMSQSPDEDVDGQSSSDFSGPQGSHVDADRLVLDRKARDYMAKNQGVDYVSAIRHVEREG